jgi:hypothetical protein
MSFQYLFFPRPDRFESGEAHYGSPEQGPHAPLQAVVNMASYGNQGTVKLGPYEYMLKEPLVIPSNVTVTGHAGYTKLSVVWTAGDPLFGPVVTLGERSGLENCIINLNFGTGGFAQDALTFTDNDGTESTQLGYANSVVKMEGQWSRLQNCEIPAGKRRGVVVNTSRAMVIGNTIRNDTDNNNAAVYTEDGVYGCIIANNACYTVAGIISVKDVADAANANVVSGNFATLVERS